MVHLIEIINDFLAAGCILPLFLFFGGFLTLKLGFPQVRHIGSGVRHLLYTEKGSKGNISNFEAISAVLAGNLGTGNIAGTAVAISVGGPGSLFWMWIMALLGTVIKYASVFLGILYREKNELGEYVGGPMFYLQKGLGSRKLAVAFCLFSIATAFTVGNLVQVNSVVIPLKSWGLPPLAIGVGFAIAVGIVLLRGMQGVANVAKTVVPFMAALYLSGCIYILAMNAQEIPGAIQLIFSSAFDPQSLTGGLFGYALLKVVSVGFERGIFATDAGTGIASVLQSEARTKSATEEAVVAMVAPWIVMIVCSITGLVLLVTGAYQQMGLESTGMCTWAFRQGIGAAWAPHLVSVTLLLFAYTTILAWAMCAERCVEFLGHQKWVKTFYYLFIATVPLGALARVDLVWGLADTCLNLMLLTNMIGIIALHSTITHKSELRTV